MHTYIYRNIKINYTDYYVPLGLVYPSQVELATYFLKHYIFFTHMKWPITFIFIFISALADEETETLVNKVRFLC